MERADFLRRHILEPLDCVVDYDRDFSGLRSDLMQLVDDIEVYQCCDLCESEIADLNKLNESVSMRLNDMYLSIMAAYDEYLEENPDNPND